MHLSETDTAELKRLLNFAVPNREVWAYGSRVYGRPRVNSDLDIAVKGADAPEIEQLKNYLSVSPISVLIDVSNYDTAPEWLRNDIDGRGVRLQ
jgi:predicted nucleotidyltransferase